jgi:hypothetical protein
MNDRPQGSPEPSATPQEDAETELLAVPRLSVYSLDDGTVLLNDPASGARMAVTAPVHGALSRCDTFRAMDEHIAGITGGQSQGPKANDVRGVLESVRESGLMVSTKALCSELNPVPTDGPVAEKPVAAIITCDRPAALARLLDSMVNVVDFGNVERFYVIDDSRSAANQEKNAEIVAKRARRLDFEITHFGAQAAREFTGRLVAELPEHEEAIRFLLDRDRWADSYSPGVARNYAQLLSVGHPLIMFDDDTVCRLFRAGFRENGITFGETPRQALFFESHEAQMQVPPASGWDPIKEHLRCLGHTVPEALGALDGEAFGPDSFRTATPEFATALRRTSRVLVTELGAVGDPGTTHYDWIGELPPASLEVLLKDDEQRRLAMSGSHCWTGANRFTFVRSATMSANTGIDNRQLLPPYFPVNRNEDKLFGEAAAFLHPDAVTVDYPLAILHLRLPPEEGAALPTNELATGFPGQLSDLPALHGSLCHASAPEDRLALLGAAYADLAAAPAEELAKLYTDRDLANRTARHERLVRNLKWSQNGPQEWTTYLEDSIRTTQQAFMAPGNGSVEVWRDAANAEMVGFWRGAWADFGAALTAWDNIRQLTFSIP